MTNAKKFAATAALAAALLGGTTGCVQVNVPTPEAATPAATETTTAPAPAVPAPTTTTEAPAAEQTGPFPMPYVLSQAINAHTADGYWVARGAAIKDAETGYYYLVVETEGPAAAGRDVALWGAETLDDTGRIWAISPMAQEVTPDLPTPFADGVALQHYDGEVLIATQYIRSQH